MTLNVLNLIFTVPVFLLSLCLNSFAHSAAALWCDLSAPPSTTRRFSNLSAHFDWVGGIVVPAICLMGAWPLLGWPRPLPPSPTKRKGVLILVALSGPVVNMGTAVLAALVLGGILRLGISHHLVSTFETLAITTVHTNVTLALFLLLPLPPLPGFTLIRFLGLRPLFRFMVLGVVAVVCALFAPSVPLQAISEGLLRWVGFVGATAS